MQSIDPEKYSAQTQYFTMHGVQIRVRCDDVQIREHVRASLLYKRATPVVSVRHPHISFHFQSVDLSPAPPEDALEVGTHEYGIRVLHSEQHLYLSTDLGLSVIDLAAAHVDCYCQRDFKGSEEQLSLLTFYQTVVSLAVLLRPLGLFSLHAAGLQYRERGMILAGDSGSGKTTLTLNLLRQGWALVSDDALLLTKAQGGIRALSFRRDLCIDPSAATTFPELRGHAWPRSLSNPSKWCIDVGQVYGQTPVAACTPSAVVLPEIAQEPISRLVPMRKRDAVIRLLEHGAHFLNRTTDLATEQFSLVGALVGQATPFRLLAGRDAIEEPARVVDLLKTALPD